MLKQLLLRTVVHNHAVAELMPLEEKLNCNTSTVIDETHETAKVNETYKEM
jgi:hypothetical protein